MQVQHLPEVIENSNTDIYAIIRIEDPDPGRHGEVESLEIIEGDPEAHFRIRPSSANDPKEFNIEVLQLLDREVSPSGYNLTLKAVDRGIPPRSSYKSIHVKLGDFNDHPPVFDREVPLMLMMDSLLGCFSVTRYVNNYQGTSVLAATLICFSKFWAANVLR